MCHYFGTEMVCTSKSEKKSERAGYAKENIVVYAKRSKENISSPKKRVSFKACSRINITSKLQKHRARNKVWSRILKKYGGNIKANIKNSKRKRKGNAMLRGEVY